MKAERVWGNVRHRDTGEATRIQRVVAIPDMFVQQPTEFVHLIRGALREVVTHEVDENIYVGGERLFDPHAAEAQ